LRGIPERLSIRTDVPKRTAAFDALNTWAAASYVAQPGFGSRLHRI
jgi:hypothetical protein